MIRLHRSSVIPDVGFTHGFPERTGGVSTGPRASLNLGARWGDDKANVTENRRRLAEHAGYDPDKLVATRHVHGTAVWRFGEPLADDAEVASEVGPVLGAFAADCIPIVFADPVARVVGACHAGWRGTVGGVAANVIGRMRELGSKPEDIRVALGPSIGPCCFEVGPEVVAEFTDTFGSLPGMIVDGPQKKHVDLRKATHELLTRSAVPSAHIDDRPPCTKCNSERFFSYRRDGREGGVHMAFIGLA
jgi:YfiH family protein